jgi:hypothetical protein
VANAPHPAPSSHKKKFAKGAVNHKKKKPVVPAKRKAVPHHAAKPNGHVKVVSHPAKKVVKVVKSSASNNAATHIVDLALAGINLRRSSGKLRKR